MMSLSADVQVRRESGRITARFLLGERAGQTGRRPFSRRRRRETAAIRRYDPRQFFRSIGFLAMLRTRRSFLRSAAAAAALLAASLAVPTGAAIAQQGAAPRPAQ